MLYSISRDANTRGVKQLLVMLENIPTYKAMKAVEKIMQSKGLAPKTIQEILKLSKQLEQEEV